MQVLIEDVVVGFGIFGAAKPTEARASKERNIVLMEDILKVEDGEVGMIDCCLGKR